MRSNKISFKEQLRGFPKWQIFLISVARFAEPVAFTSFFPYVYFMVRDFGIAKNESEVSKYVGYLSSSFALFEFIFSIQFGYFADKFGRKKVLIMGLFGMMISILIFGFSKNYYQALLGRSLMGAFNGNIAVVRTVVGELAVNKNHQALAFSTIPLLWQIGCVVGPMSGYLVKTDNLSLIKLGMGGIEIPYLNKLLEKYPYCLSNIVIAIFLLFSVLLLSFFLEETHPDLKYKVDYGLKIGDLIRKKLGFKIPAKRPWELQNFEISRPLEVSEESLLIDNSEDTFAYDSANLNENIEETLSQGDSSNSMSILSRQQSNALVETYSQSNSVLSKEQLKDLSNWQSLMLPSTSHTLLSTFIMSTHCLIFDEFLPVFLSYEIIRETPDDPSSKLISKFPFKIVGGLGYDSSSIGRVLSYTGFAGVLMVILVFPFLDRNFDPVKCYRFLLQFFPITYLMLPFLIFTLPPNFISPTNTYLTSVSLYTLFLLKTFGQANAYPEIYLLVHRASPPKNRAFINGVLMSSIALGRFFGPLIWGSIMSWSNTHEVGWFTWWSLALLALIGSIQVFFLNVDDEDDDEFKDYNNSIDEVPYDQE
ncbi:hypothetical protein PACTADRAFT_50600 [Pachysolen tannophilus NRRL Y-2460]|uniref:Major facilitator superfamily (MFS) profile domain-containing protein n=1 Tax=Pachysolen tannophilus NRRL Y-2460 TaxID=669874 RepID=A0A1E4TSN4_PACTA|nr:hypothetical protein PACTADRAFT_50600 [Pachysolen tannophilus NRRL Y-2460]